MSVSPLPVDRPNDRRLPTSLFGYDLVQWLGAGRKHDLRRKPPANPADSLALKHVLRKTHYDDRYIAQVENEYVVGKGIEHPNLRRSLDLKMHRTMLGKVVEAALVMDLVDGQPLDSLQTLSIQTVVSCFSQAARALHHLHGLGFVHCDLKPNNILLAENGNAKVIDLGQACAIGTVKERIQGTPDYIAPEQVKRNAVTAKTDIYNFVRDALSGSAAEKCRR